MGSASPSEIGNANHGHTKPRALSAAQEFSHLKKERLETLQAIMPLEHFGLYAKLNGKHPRDMAHTVADAFEASYSVVPGIRLRVLNHLYWEHGKKQPISFYELNRRLASLEDQFHENSPCLELVESLRAIFELLDRPKRYDLDSRVSKDGEDATFSPKQIELQWLSCRHCWRRVYRYPSQNGTPLCEAHNYKSTDKEYRHRERMREKYTKNWLGLHGSCALALREFKRLIGTKFHGEHFTLLLCGILPNVGETLVAAITEDKYDLEALHNEFCAFAEQPEESPLWSLPLDQHEEYMRTHQAPGAGLIRAILDILDPPPSATKTNLAEARERFVVRITWNFAEYIDYLYQAEAWMEAEKDSQHGGNRNKTGCRMENP